MCRRTYKYEFLISQAVKEIIFHLNSHIIVVSELNYTVLVLSADGYNYFFDAGCMLTPMVLSLPVVKFMSLELY